ncbi:MAG TPA: PEP-utilizing enzyme [Gemmatimonadaceae bacterium]|nr:PEP-utilizing enzyme [Gemmatimonadaceae bacterium]
MTEQCVVIGGIDRRAMDCAPKAAMLHRASLAGVAIPDAVVIPDSEFDAWRDAGCALPKHLSSAMLVVRSAFAAEDGVRDSHAGAFVSVMRVPGNEPVALAAAAARVRASGGESGMRRDLLVMRLVEAKQAGVAFTEREHEDDLVNVVNGTAEELLSGRVSGQTLDIPRCRRNETPDALLPPWAQRLQRVMQLVRDLSKANRWGNGDWDVEWADDGETCWVVQLRPVTRATVRNEWFTLANHREILPPLPSRFMATLIASCAGGLFAWYRRADAALPATRPFIEVFEGRPVINLSLLTDMLRTWGLPTRYVTDAIGGRDVHPVGWRLDRMRTAAPALLRMLWAQFTAVGTTRRARLTILSRDLLESEGQVTPLVQAAQRRYVLLVQSMFALTAAMATPLALLRRTGTLAAHLSRQRTPGSDVVEALRRDVVPAVQDNPDDIARIAVGEPPASQAGAFEWMQWLERHGHRGPYESDLAQARWREQPAAVLALLRHELAYPIAPRAEQYRSIGEWLTLPLWWLARRPLRAREGLRDDAMVAFAMIRELLHGAADKAVARGALRRRDDIWLLSIDEAVALDAGVSYDAAFFEAREHERREQAAVTVPTAFRRFDRLRRDLRKSPTPVRDAWQGIGLAPGRVTGRAWCAEGPTSVPPVGWTPTDTILIVPAVDAAWALLFRRVAGVVVETGGELSHASIILRELGVPSVTNVRAILGDVQTGDPLWLDAARGHVSRTN